MAQTKAQGFLVGEVSRLSGVPAPTIQHWAATNLLVPSIRRGSGRGRGHEKRYSLEDVRAGLVINKLRRLGIGTKSLRRVINYLRREQIPEPPMAYAKLIVIDGGRDVVLALDNKKLVSTLQAPGQLALVLDLACLTTELERKIKRAA